MHRLPFFDDCHRTLRERFDGFARTQLDPLAARDESDTNAVAREYVRRLAGGGWLSFIDPIDIRAATLLRERLGYGSALADTMLAMQGLGGLPIALHGDAAQRSAWLPRIRGGAIAAFALTEPDAGSDPAGMKLHADRDAAAGGGWRLTGEKSFISNAGLADVYVVFARTAATTASAGNASAGASAAAHTAFIVPGDAAGLSVEPIELIAPHPIGAVRFNGVVVPDDHRLGGEGDGLKVALGTLDRFRCSVAAAACGMARRALDESLAHVRRREQFGKPLAKFQGVQFMLAEMAAELEAAQLLTARAAWLVDGGGENDSAANGEPRAGAASPSPQPSRFKGERTGGTAGGGLAPDNDVKRAVSIAKLYATDHAHAIIDRAVQLHGGGGLVRGATVERLYREIRALRIYEGTSEIQKLVIARTLL